MYRAILLLAACGLICACDAAPVETGPVVLAASSMTEAMEDAADAWAADGRPEPVLSFASSSALARQIERGAPADLFVSADEAWMDVLASKQLIRNASRTAIAGNALVMIAPAGGAAPMDIAGGPAIAGTLLAALGADGRIAMADPATVPAGRYGRAALGSLGLWAGLANRIAPAQNVRAALALVERGAAPLGIVYATDAAASKRVRIVARFPDASHAPIRYPAAIPVAARHPDAGPFLTFLQGDEAQAIFRRHGFKAPQ